MITVLGIFIFFVIMFLLASILYHQLGSFKWLFHDVLGWHMPNNFYNFDGVNLSSRCKYCGKEIMQDSQGNWF